MGDANQVRGEMHMGGGRELPEQKECGFAWDKKSMGAPLNWKEGQ